MEILILGILAAVMAGGVGLVLVRLRGLGSLAEAERQGFEERLAERDGRLAELTRRLHEVDTAHDALAVEAAEARTAFAAREAQMQALAADLTESRSRQEAMGEALAAARADLSRVQETLAQERRSAQEKLDTLLRAREEMTAQFKALAGDILKQHGEQFSRSSGEKLESTLAPLRERIEGFQKRLNEVHADDTRGRSELTAQVRHLMELNARMSQETTNLTRALKGQNQVQGAWGEMILERILESSGLRKGEEYVTQDTHTDDENRRLRPDVVITLPGGRCVVIDAKVSLTAYERYVAADDDSERDAALKQHVTSLRNHIAGLARKPYADAVSGSIDYILMFIPIEGAFAAAVAADRELTEAAIAARIGLTTPTTLMTALRTVAHLWQVERRNANAQKIAEEAGRMYDKFVGFAEDMVKLGAQIGTVQQTHASAMTKLSDGRGNLVVRLERLKRMGIGPKKVIPDALLRDAGADAESLAAAEEMGGDLFADGAPPDQAADPTDVSEEFTPRRLPPEVLGAD